MSTIGLIDQLRTQMHRFRGRERRRHYTPGPDAVPIDHLPGAVAGGPIAFVNRYEADVPNPGGCGVIFGREFNAERALYIDTETTGLSATAGTLPFLIGWGWFEEGRFVIEQALMRNPSDEVAALGRLSERARTCAGVVTFNGKSFDIPLLDVRYVLHRLRSGLSEMPHLDLLHPSRRLFRPRLWSCRLIALEEGVLGIRRRGDVDGHLIPGLYANYLRTGDAGPLAAVVEHNRTDILSMPNLLATLARKAEDPLAEAEDAFELVAIGRMQLNSGDEALGVRCLQRASEVATLPGVRRRALVALAHALRRSGDVEGLAVVWSRYAREFPDENVGYVELAKVYEHRKRDLRSALDVAAAAPETTESLLHRIHRLQGRLSLLPRGDCKAAS